MPNASGPPGSDRGGKERQVTAEVAGPPSPDRPGKSRVSKSCDCPYTTGLVPRRIHSTQGGIVAASRSRRYMRRALVVPGVFVALIALAGQALAVVPITTVAEDPYTNTNAWHQALVEPDTYSYGSTIVAAFQGGGRFADGGSDN